MLTHATILDRLSRFLGVAGDRLTDQSAFVEDLGIDSLDRLAMAAELEEEFDVIITDAALRNVRTIGDMSHCISNSLEQRRIERLGSRSGGDKLTQVTSR